MTSHPFFIRNDHDSKHFGMNAYDLLVLSDKILNEIKKNPGHYTYKTNPLTSKKKLHEHDFYYCDTLIEPYCTTHEFNFYENKLATFGELASFEELLPICNDAFIYGRFHRDFNIDKAMAEKRYHHWLKSLHEKQSIYTLYYENQLAGFIGYTDNKLVLHALHSQYRGRGLAKYFWSSVCKDLYSKEHHEITSSISATNLAAMNLYASLGFKFRNALDVYHRVIK